MTVVAAERLRRSLMPVWVAVVLSVVLAATALGVALNRGAETTPTHTTAPAPVFASVPVPQVLGLTKAAAVSHLQVAGLRLGRVVFASSNVPAGTVVATTPTAGSALLNGSAVTLIVSLGPPTKR